MTSRASSPVTPLTSGTPRLTMPAFSPAIAANVLPNCRVWSKLMLVMTETSGVQTFVASKRPPSPTSKTARSIFSRAKCRRATAVRISK